MEHTGGPWIAGEPFAIKHAGYDVLAIPVSGSGAAIASVWAGTPRSASVGLQSDGPANARLIAAAPTMAAALRAIHGYASGMTPAADAVTALLEIEGYARNALAQL